MAPRYEVDLDDDGQADLAMRIGLAWRDLRRVASMTALRQHLFGTPEGTLEPGQVDTLELIVQRPAWRMSELADALRIDPSTATRAVQRMVALGLAERRACLEDGRVVMISATEMGREWHAKLVSNRRELWQHVLGDFSPADRERFAELIERFVGGVDTFVTGLPAHGDQH